MLIDTPGVLDPGELDQDIEQSSSKDMTDKLKALGNLNGILLLMSKSQGGRLVPSTVQTIKALEYMFADTKQNVFLHLSFAYSKCDPEQKKEWGSLVKKRDKEFNSIIDGVEECGVLVSVHKSIRTDSKTEAKKRFYYKDLDEEYCRLFFLSAKFCNEEINDPESEIFKMIRIFDSAGDLRTKYIRDPSKYLRGNFFLLI